MRCTLSPSTHNEIRHIYQQGLEPAIGLFDKTIQELEKENQNQNLCNQLSEISSKSPSSDGLKKPLRIIRLRENGSKMCVRGVELESLVGVVRMRQQ